jgi:hypothetical protein
MSEFPQELLWLADAPLFIDEKQVEAFYDATLQPDYEELSQTLGESVTAETKIEGGLTLGAVLPWLAKAEAQAGASRSKQRGEDRSATWNRVSNPYRHLLALVLQYLQGDLKGRLVLAGEGGCRDGAGKEVILDDVEFAHRSPRALIMLDLPAGTPFIPAALELANGEVVQLFEAFAQRLTRPGETSLPPYPSGSGPEVAQGKRDYWSWFVKAYDKRIALEVVEDAVRDSSIAWIDYRVPFAGGFPHLHFAGRGRYETGVFGYQLVSRGFGHGIRIAGTLKAEPDINVLAAFER